MDPLQLLSEADAEVKNAAELEKLRLACLRKAQEAIAAAQSSAQADDHMGVAAEGIEHARRLADERGQGLRHAVALCDQVLSVRPDHPQALNRKGQAILQLGQVEAGLQLLRAAVVHGPDDVVLCVDLARTLIDLGRTDEALAVAEEVVARKPTVLLAHDLRFGLYAMLNRPEKAQAAQKDRESCLAQLRCQVEGAERWQIVAAAAAARAMSQRSADLICFISERPRGRDLKMAQALLRAGKQVVLLHRDEVQFDLSASFSHVIRYSDGWHALKLATEIPAQVFHLFSLAADETSILFIRHKPGPVVFDANDVFPGMNNLALPRHLLEWQTEALQNADALCCRDLQYRAAARCNGWHRHPQVIWFPEYIDDLAPIGSFLEDGVVRAVSAGNLHTGAGSSAAGAEMLLRPLVEQGVHIEIFPHFFFWNRSPEEIARAHAGLLALGAATGRVTLRPWVPPDRLAGELAQFGVGLLFSNHYLDQGKKDYSMESLAACGSARETDYLGGRLLLVGDRPIRLIRFIARRYGEWLDIDDAMAPGGLEKMRAGVRRAKERSGKAIEGYTMAHNIRRLIAFYSRVAGDRLLADR